MTPSSINQLSSSTSYYLPLTSAVKETMTLFGITTRSDPSVTTPQSQVAQELELPTDLNPEVMIQLLASISSKIAGVELVSRQGAIESNEILAKDQRMQIIEKLIEGVKQRATITADTKSQQLQGLWMAGLALLLALASLALPAAMPAMIAAMLAAVGVAAAGGFAAGMTALTVVVVVAAAMAVLSFINAALQYAGVKVNDVNGEETALDITLAGLVQACIAQQIHDGAIVRVDAQGRCINAKGELDSSIVPAPGARFMTQAQIDKMAGDITIGITVGVMVTMLVAGLAGGKGLMSAIEESLKVVEKMGQFGKILASAVRSLEAVAALVESGAAVLGGALEISQSATGLKLADDVRAQSLTKAEQAALQALLEVLQQQIAFDQQAVGQINQRFDQLIQQASASLQQISDSLSAVMRNTASNAAA